MYTVIKNGARAPKGHFKLFDRYDPHGCGECRKCREQFSADPDVGSAENAGSNFQPTMDVGSAENAGSNFQPTMDVGSAENASLHGCNLLGQRRSSCRGAIFSRPFVSIVRASFYPLLSHKYERHGLYVTTEDRIPHGCALLSGIK